MWWWINNAVNTTDIYLNLIAAFSYCSAVLHVMILISTHSWRAFRWLLGWAGLQGIGGLAQGGGGGRSSAPYGKPAVAVCEALLTGPSMSHLLTDVQCNARRGDHTHTEGEQVSRCALRARGLGFASYVSGTAVLLSPLSVFKSVPRPPAGDCLKDEIDKTGGGWRGRGRRIREKGRGREWTMC